MTQADNTNVAWIGEIVVIAPAGYQKVSILVVVDVVHAPGIIENMLAYVCCPIGRLVV
jgi:hypothetical protein